MDPDITAVFGSYFHERGPTLVSVAGGEQYLPADDSVSEGPAPTAGEFAVRLDDVSCPISYEP